MNQVIKVGKLPDGYTSPAGIKYPSGWGLWLDDELSLVGDQEEIESMIKVFKSETTNENS